ncbi:MAG: thioredoxin [Anaerolineae bacterium]|nr:MAG: thioredoxin [Anaerolineae bacterium]
MAEVSYVNEQNFQSEVLASSVPVLVDFTAAWCGPCKMIAPVIEQLHTEWQGRVKVVKCDADQNPQVLMRYGILGIPTLILYKNGQVAERVTGYLPKEKLVSKFLPHI